jgi:ElaB/YqjD/DUF883 family membrane-anchored ribosome-binding protein
LRWYFDMQEDRMMWGQKNEGGNRSMVGSDSGNGAFLSTQQATEAIEKLRSGIDQASRAVRDLTQVGGHWAQDVQDRARDMAKDLRSQGERAVGTVSQQVEHNPLTSLGIAFAVGFICAALIRR